MITTEYTVEDSTVEGTLRPQMLKDYIGQQKVKENLKIYIDPLVSRGKNIGKRFSLQRDFT